MPIIVNHNDITKKQMIELFRRKIKKYQQEKRRILIACDQQFPKELIEVLLQLQQDFFIFN